MPVKEEIGQVLFEETAQLTGITEYGISWDNLIKGEAQLPPQGARFDIAFEGDIVGQRLKGSVRGVNFLNVRADGRFDMTIYATIRTHDNATIAFHESGVLVPDPEEPAQLSEYAVLDRPPGLHLA